MVKVGKDFWRSSGPTSAQGGHTEQVVQDHGQVTFEDLQGGILYNFSGQEMPACHFLVDSL